MSIYYRASFASLLCSSTFMLCFSGNALAQAAAPQASAPQTSGLSRTLVGRADVSVPGREAVVAKVEVAPGSRAGRHTHPGTRSAMSAKARWICWWTARPHAPSRPVNPLSCQRA